MHTHMHTHAHTSACICECTALEMRPRVSTQTHKCTDANAHPTAHLRGLQRLLVVAAQKVQEREVGQQGGMHLRAALGGPGWGHCRGGGTRIREGVG